MSNDNLVIKPKKPKGEDGYKVFSIRVKEELVVQIDTISTKTGRSRNELIGMFLEYAIGHCVIEKWWIGIKYKWGIYNNLLKGEQNDKDSNLWWRRNYNKSNR